MNTQVSESHTVVAEPTNADPQESDKSDKSQFIGEEVRVALGGEHWCIGNVTEYDLPEDCCSSRRIAGVQEVRVITTSPNAELEAGTLLDTYGLSMDWNRDENGASP